MVNNQKEKNSDLGKSRDKLLYLIYRAQKNRIKDNPGTKAKICRALNFSSDGLFYYHFDNLKNNGLIEIKDGYIQVTDLGKSKFNLIENSFSSSSIIIAIGVLLIFLFFPLKLNFLPIEGIIIAGMLCFLYGFTSFAITKRGELKLPSEAKKFLRELK